MDCFANEKDYMLLDNDKYTFYLLKRLLGGENKLLLTDHEKLIICFSCEPYHDTTLTNVASGRGICLAPGFLNDHSGQFAWTPFDCKESFSCVLCTHKTDSREGLKEFVEVLQKLYREAVAFPM